MSTIKDISKRIKDIEADRVAGVLTPVEAGRLREKEVINGIHEIASQCSAHIEPITSFDSRGELMIVATAHDGENARFGHEFAAILSLVPNRWGVAPATCGVGSDVGWTRINHFDAEKITHIYADMNGEPLHSSHVDISM